MRYKVLLLIFALIAGVSCLFVFRGTHEIALPKLGLLKGATFLRRTISSYVGSDSPPHVRGLSYHNETYFIHQPIEDCLTSIEIDPAIRGIYSKRGRNPALFTAFLSPGFVQQARYGTPYRYVEIDVGRGKDPLKLGREDASIRNSWTWIELTSFWRR